MSGQVIRQIFTPKPVTCSTKGCTRPLAVRVNKVPFCWECYQEHKRVAHSDEL